MHNCFHHSSLASMVYPDPDQYIAHLNTACLPKGFSLYRDRISFLPRERPGAGPYGMNISALISEEEETIGAAVATGNRYPGAPVTLLRERALPGPLRGVVVNNKVANVGAPQGLEHARALADALAAHFSLPQGQTLSISTGVIGWELPVGEIQESIAHLSAHRCSPREWAEGIMTTDRYPKAVWSGVGDTGATMLGFVKGAGMIEPNMATMLGFFVTDLAVAPQVLHEVLRRVVDRSFNAISVDGDQSTSDMVVAMANGVSGGSCSALELERVWQPLADQLALEVVRNGEGTAHVIEVTVRGLANTSLARHIGRQVVNSPLVKTAVYGNDPNIGRILGAVGSALNHYDGSRTVVEDDLSIAIAGTVVYRDRAFVIDASTEEHLSAAMKAAAMDPVLRGMPQVHGTVPIVLDFGVPDAEEIRILGSDLSYEYVRENADYRT